MRRTSLAAALVLFGTGCVQVAQPVGDIDVAEPNKELLGTWKMTDGGQLVVDRPDVKGNPKGLMRVRHVKEGEKAEAVTTSWVFTATVGKHAYGNLLSSNRQVSPDLSKEGAYAAWAKSPARGYLVAKVALDGDTLTIDDGGWRAFADLMKREKIDEVGGYYATPPGWLEKYLGKQGPDAIFKGSATTKYTRAKKE